MKTAITLNLRAFHVLIRDERTNEQRSDVIVFEKQQLKTAEDMGITPDDLIYRRYNEQGYRVMDIHKARKRTFALDLKTLYAAPIENARQEAEGYPRC